MATSPRARLARLLLLAAAVLILSGCTVTSTRPPASSTPSRPGRIPSLPIASIGTRPGHVLWGIGGGNVLAFLPRLESEIGRPFAVVRKYSLWNAAIPGTVALAAAARGAIPYVSWEVYRQNAPSLTFADVADGSQDSWIRTEAEAIKRSGVHMLFTFMHEPEFSQGQGAKPQAGPPSEYVAAFERVHRIFQQVGVTNVAWVADLGESTFAGLDGGPDAWMPPAADYSMVAADGYVKWPCEPGRANLSFAQLFGPAEAFARSVDKPLMIGEVGVQEFDACGNSGGAPDGKARWIDAAATTIRRWPDVRVVCWTYGSNYKFGPGVTLVWNEDSSPQALSAFRTAGLDSYFRGSGWSSLTAALR
ncbi:MAG TPA: hypothetical protein VEM41_10365 [Actinomycetota bacterium]|nr:hypothetical protein [Actinomycetota bacterium]